MQAYEERRERERKRGVGCKQTKNPLALFSARALIKKKVVFIKLAHRLRIRVPDRGFYFEA